MDKNGNVGVDQLKNFVINYCKDDMVNKKINKKDIEGFLSAFIYNTYGGTSINELPKIVFSEENYVSKKLNHRKRANPPPPEVNGDLDLYTYGDSPEEIHNWNTEKVLQQLEDKVFAGPVKMYQVFKQFDKDGDGYVSYADFEDQLNALQVSASKQEVVSILKLFDKENKGYLDFRAFSQHVSPNMSSLVNVKKNEVHLPNLVPNKDKNTEYGNKASQLINAVNEVRR